MRCNALSPNEFDEDLEIWWPWICTLPVGHESDHEAHCTDDNSDAPAATWPYTRKEIESRATRR